MDRQSQALATAHIFNVLRILKAKNPGDSYYDEYLKHYAREGNKFYDQYHVALERVIDYPPKRILEIGVRTGLSICNMLSAYINYKVIERVVLVDIWNDGFASPEIVKMNLRALNIPMDKIEFVKGDSKVEVPKLEGKFDFILVDGDHEKVAAREDLENVVRLCAQDGVIVFDDLSIYGCNLQDVWDNFTLAHIDEFVFDQDVNGKGVGWATKL
jgi:SAM-dependent methyltransferase